MPPYTSGRLKPNLWLEINVVARCDLAAALCTRHLLQLASVLSDAVIVDTDTVATGFTLRVRRREARGGMTRMRNDHDENTEKNALTDVCRHSWPLPTWRNRDSRARGHSR